MTNTRPVTFLICTLVCGISAGNIFAAKASNKSFKIITDTGTFCQEIKSRSLAINTIESSFVQETHLDILSQPIRATGYFCFKRPGLVRWEYLKPFSYLIVINGDDAYIKDENKTQHYDINSNKLFARINGAIMSALSGDIIKTNGDFSFALFESDKEYLIAMKPLRKKLMEFLKDIKVYLDKGDFSMSTLQISEPSGDYTRISFREKKINLPIDDQKFNID